MTSRRATTTRRSPLSDHRAGPRLLPSGGRLPQLQQRRCGLAAARVRHLRRAGRRPHPDVPARPATAGRHHPPHRAARTVDKTLRRVMEQLVELSTRLVVMTERSRAILTRRCITIPDDKIDLIVHGIPDRSFADPNFYKDQFGVEGKLVGLTFGLLLANKGIEVVLRALPAVIVRRSPTSSTSSWERPTRAFFEARARPIGSASSGWPKNWASRSTSSSTTVLSS